MVSLNWVFSVRAQEMKSSAIREILKITERPDVISFAGGLPAPELFPIQELKKACAKVLDTYGPKALQYSLTPGVLPLRQILAERLSKKGPTLTVDNVFITGGSQHYTEVEYCVQISPWDYRGDAQPPGGDGVVDIGDVLFIISYLYKGGSAPVPLSEGDVNCDGIIDLGDVLFLISYLYKGGPVSKCCDL